MLIIRTAQDMASALNQPLDTPLKDCLRSHCDILSHYGGMPLEALGLFVIVQAGDRLDAIQQSCGYRLVAKGSFAFPVENVTHLSGWYEVVWIISDDGYGLVLFVQDHADTDQELLAACRQAAE